MLGQVRREKYLETGHWCFGATGKLARGMDLQVLEKYPVSGAGVINRKTSAGFLLTCWSATPTTEG